MIFSGCGRCGKRLWFRRSCRDCQEEILAAEEERALVEALRRRDVIRIRGCDSSLVPEPTLAWVPNLSQTGCWCHPRAQA